MKEYSAAGAKTKDSVAVLENKTNALEKSSRDKNRNKRLQEEDRIIFRNSPQTAPIESATAPPAQLSSARRRLWMYICVCGERMQMSVPIADCALGMIILLSGTRLIGAAESK